MLESLRNSVEPFGNCSDSADGLQFTDMLKVRIVTLLLFVLSSVASVWAQQSSPKASIAAFYAFDGKNSQTFNRKNIDARKRWFSDQLYKLFLKELDREADYLKKNPTDKPHFGDGLPFRPLDEPCSMNGRTYRRSITYGQVTVKGDLGNVDVHFKYPKGCNIPDILYAVNMEREKGRWVISDIRYFPGDTSLIEDLGRKEY
jgi:hypothetical protein